MKDEKIVKQFIYVIIFIALIVITIGSLITKNKTTFIVCYILGTLGAILYIISLYHDIISLNLKRKVSKKGYYIRYIFSASIFLLAGVIFEEKLTAIISVFLGLINVKISAYLVGFLFGGGWHEKKD